MLSSHRPPHIAPVVSLLQEETAYSAARAAHDANQAAAARLAEVQQLLRQEQAAAEQATEAEAAASAAALAAAGARAQMLKPGWQEMQDRSRQTYYFNPTTQVRHGGARADHASRLILC